MIAIFKKEFTSYFSGLFGWTILSLMTLAIGILTLLMNLVNTTVELSYTILYLSDTLILFIPFVCAHTFTTERIRNTAPWLRSLPVSPMTVLLGKYLAALALLSIPTALLILLPPILANFGTVSYGSAYTIILGYFLLTACLLGICALFSSLASSKLASILGGIGILLDMLALSLVSSFLSVFPALSLVLLDVLFVTIGALILILCKKVLLGISVAILPTACLAVLFIAFRHFYQTSLPEIFDFVNCFDRLNGFSSGRIDLPAVLFYLGITVACLFLIPTLSAKNLWMGGRKK